jgi:DNA mismatch endonuclease, patch repair protein
VDGCFWHGCPTHGTTVHHVNDVYWRTKIDTNQARDADTAARLVEAGWTVIRVWEHEDASEAADHIEATVRARTAADPRRPV